MKVKESIKENTSDLSKQHLIRHDIGEDVRRARRPFCAVTRQRGRLDAAQLTLKCLQSQNTTHTQMPTKSKHNSHSNAYKVKT